MLDRIMDVAKRGRQSGGVGADLNVFGIQITFFLALGAAILWFYDRGDAWFLALWALACLIGGGAIGFLFGIPKIVQSDVATGPATGAGGAVPAAGEPYRQLVNTNLTEISDWLTKIVVGLGLVQLRQLPDALNRAAATVGGGLPAKPAGNAFAMALILYFTVSGFLCGYIYTRLWLAGALQRAEKALADTKRDLAAAQEHLATVQKQSQTVATSAGS